MNARDIIRELHQKCTDSSNEWMARNLANALESLSSDIFTEYIRFLFELIQNADDAGAKDVVINLQPDHLVLAHDGKAFSPDDVESLCSIGEGTKKADQTKTGYKGIGFKSVFGKSKHVAVFSEGFQFKFTNDFRHPQFPDTPMPWQIIPVWAEREDYPEEVFALPGDTDWNVVTVMVMNGTGQLQKDLMELIGNGEVLLFLRHLLNITVIGSMGLTISRTVRDGNDAYREVSIRKNGKVISEWITQTFENIPITPEVRTKLAQDEKTPEKLQKAERAELSFAAKVLKGKITRLEAEESLIYTYLPTKVKNFRFPFLLNSSFLTNAGREELHDDRTWNEWLMEQAGMKLLDWLAMLAQTKFYSGQILVLLPTDSHLGGNLAQHFYEALRRHAENTPFVPSRTGALLKANDTLVDYSGLSETAFISGDAVVEYYNSTKHGQLSPEALIRTGVVQPSALKALGAHFFELDDLEAFFTSETFRRHHEPKQNYDLIKYFHAKAKGNREWSHRLAAVPFIYAKGKKLHPPAALCFPTMEYENEFGEEVTVLHKIVYNAVEKDAVIREWLESMGVKEPSDDAYLENEIIGKVRSCVTVGNHRKMIRFLFEKGRRGELASNHYQALRSIKLMTTSSKLVEAQYCYLSDRYEPRLKLENVHDAGQYVSSDYIESRDLVSDWKSFLLRLGVAESIAIAHERASRYLGQPSIPSAYWDVVAAEAKQQAANSYPHLVGESNTVDLSRITFSEYAKQHVFSKVFWEQVFEEINPTSISRYANLHWGYYGSTWPVQNYIPWSLRNEAIFPATTGECLAASRVIINLPEILKIGGDVLPVFDCPEVIKDDWLEIIPFRTQLELEDYLKVLEHISNQRVEEDGVRRRPDRERIGLVYARLSRELRGFSTAKRETLRDWAKENVLLASDGEFVLPSELKWEKEARRKVPRGRIRTLLVPEECPTDEGFEQLLRELGVEVIDTFTISASEEREDSALMERLKPLVPFLALVAAVRQSEDLMKVLKRIERRREKLRLLQCSDLSLVFKAEGVEMPGEPMQCHWDGNTIRYKGSWSGKSTLYEFIPELARALDVPKLDMDLMRLLQSDLDEIGAFMDELGADVMDLPADVRESALMGLMIDDEDEESIPTSSKNHLAQAAKNEANREARELVLKKLISLGYDTTKADATHSVVNGVYKDGKEHPLVIKSYRNTSYKFNIRPNEWTQLDRENAMFWVHRGGGNLAVLRLEDLLAANREFHVQFETDTFGREGMLKFAKAFQFLRNVHFQLDAPYFRMADALDEYRFNAQTEEKLEKGGDSDNMLH